jgi:hypothetical protein
MKRTRVLAILAAVFCLLFVASPRASAEPSLWVVKGPHATVYLFGSVHVLKKDVPWRTPKIDAALQQSGSLWLEITNADDPQVLQPLVMELGVDQAHPISTKISKEELAKLDKVATVAGIPNGEAGVEPLKPWLVAVMLSVAPMVKAGYDPNSGVENVLKPEFTKANKPVQGFETAEQQLHYFADMPEKQQIDYLIQGIDDFEKDSGKFDTIVASWYAGDDSNIDKLMSEDFKDKMPDLYQVLIVKRNQAFAAQIDKLLKGDGTVFVAVGAAHLVGSDGVNALLTKMGYTVVKQ